MADLEKQPRGVRDNLIASAIVEVVRWGWPTVSAWLVTQLTIFQALPDYGKVLVVIVVFAVMAGLTSLAIRVFRQRPVTASGSTVDTDTARIIEPRSVNSNTSINANTVAPIFAPVFNVGQEITQRQDTKQQQSRSREPRPTAEIEMRQFVAKTIRVNDSSLNVLAVPFRNNSDAGVVNVIAQISFENAKTHQTHDVNYGFWIESADKHAVLGIGTTNHIALAGCGIYQPNVTLDTKWTRQYVGAYCQTLRLEDGIWQVRITLIGNSFRESYPPFTIEADKNGVRHLREPVETQRIGKAERIKTLSEFAEEGRVILLQGKDMETNWPKANEWAARAEVYIRENVSEEDAAWFCLATTEPWPSLAIDRRFVDWMHTRIQRLGVLATEIRKH